MLIHSMFVLVGWTQRGSCMSLLGEPLASYPPAKSLPGRSAAVAPPRGTNLGTVAALAKM